MGFDILRLSTIERLLQSEWYALRSHTLIALAEWLNADDLSFAIKQFDRSQAQFLQDLFVLLQSGRKRNGFFVEFGATNGRDLSNTYLLEKNFQWHGILVEPARTWHAALSRNRACSIDHRCVWKASGERVKFREVFAPEISTIGRFAGTDYRSHERAVGRDYEVETVSLTDLLAQYNAPPTIDYVSIDTEGSELEILQGFDFDRYDARIITVEHNYTPRREQIFELLSSKGFVRKYETCSQVDDWYVKETARG